MHWKVKGIVQKALGHVPGSHALHYQLQRRFGGLQNFGRELAMKVDDWQIMVGHLRNARVDLGRSHFLEIGTGWYPTFPLALYLAGARQVTTYDLKPHLRRDLLLGAAQELGNFIALIAEVAGVEVDGVHTRHAALMLALGNGEDLQTASGGVIHYAAPADATRTGLDAGAVDVVFSNSVLEHVPPEVIAAMYAESMRVLAPGGLMFHSVNCGDHYAYVDRSVNQLNYLRYSDAEWHFWNNEFLYQNRMRAHEFVAGAAAAGFGIELDTSTARESRLRELASMPVHPQFAHVPAERLCITSVDFIARKPVAPDGVLTAARS